MAAHTQVETSQTVTRQTITTTLKDDSLWAVPFHNMFDNWFKDAFIGNVIYAISEREVDRIILPCADTNVTQFAGPGEVFSIFMEWDRHNAVGGIKCLLDTIAMVDININIKNTLFETQKLENAENNVFNEKLSASFSKKGKSRCKTYR